MRTNRFPLSDGRVRRRDFALVGTTARRKLPDPELWKTLVVTRELAPNRHNPVFARRMFATPISVPKMTKNIPRAEGITAGSICAPTMKSPTPE